MDLHDLNLTLGELSPTARWRWVLNNRNIVRVEEDYMDSSIGYVHLRCNDATAMRPLFYDDLLTVLSLD